MSQSATARSLSALDDASADPPTDTKTQEASRISDILEKKLTCIVERLDSFITLTHEKATSYHQELHGALLFVVVVSFLFLYATLVFLSFSCKKQQKVTSNETFVSMVCTSK